MKILKLEAENVKRLKAIRVQPDPNDPLVVVKGNNAQGKSSLLDAIRFAFAGKAVQPPRPVRDGATEAFVEVETETLIITRRWTGHDHEDGPSTEVEVRAKDGGKLKSPQTVLDHLYGNLAFDPLEFMRLKPVEQAQEVKRVVGVDTDDLDLEHEKIFTERTGTNSKLRDAEGRLKGLPTEPPPVRVDLGALLSQQTTITNSQRTAADTRAVRDAAMRRVADCRDHVRTAELSVKQAQEAHAAAVARLKGAEQAAAVADNAADELAAESVHVAELAKIRDAIEKASGVAVANDRWGDREKVAAEVKALESKTKAQTKEIDRIAAEKSKRLQAATFPIPGLSFTSSGVKFNGLALEQASSAEQLRVSVAMGMAANPKLQVMLSREGSLLDDKSLDLLREMCREKSYQLWIEIVGENGPATVLIRDGEVVSRPPALKVVKNAPAVAQGDLDV